MVISDPFRELNCTEQEGSWPEIAELSCRNGAKTDESAIVRFRVTGLNRLMSRPPTSPTQAAARRAQWLGELRQALDDANRIALRLRDLAPAGREAALLHLRILALRAEIDALQRARPSRPAAVHPKRMD